MPHLQEIYVLLLDDPTTTDREGGGRTATEVERESPERYRKGGQENLEPRQPHDDGFSEGDRPARDNDVKQGGAGRESDGRFDESVIE